MGILDEDVVRVRETADIVAVISQHTQLRKVGTRWTGLCPFHNEKSPSFSVNAQEGLYYCFGCRASGDVITFVRQIEHTDFVGAVEWLAGRANIDLRYTEQNESEARKRKARLYDLMGRAVTWYHEQLKASPGAARARGYLRSRGFDGAMVDQFQVGWAPDSWDDLAKHLKAPVDLLTDCGLGFVNKRNRTQDFFRSRILFPIFDDQGRPVAFGGRKLPDAEGPKYQNSRENVLYNKSAVLYALNWAKTDIVHAGAAIVCEGYTDVIGFHRAGLPRAVATCGTALTEDHLRTLKRFTNRIVLAYDADEAGQAAAERVYEWERKFDLQVSVLALPPGTDPDELAQSDPAALATAVEDARPFLGFRVERVLRAADLTGPEGRARAAGAALDVIREHPDPLVRDQYVMSVADRVRVDPERLREQLARPAVRTEEPERRQGRAPDSADHGAPAPQVKEGVETEALRLVIAGAIGVDDGVRPELFRPGPVRDAYETLLRSGGDVLAAVEESSPAMADLLARLAAEEPTAEPDDIRIRLAEAAGERALRTLDREARQSDDPLGYTPILSWLKLRLDDLRGDVPSMDAVDELLAWLAEQAGDRP